MKRWLIIIASIIALALGGTYIWSSWQVSTKGLPRKASARGDQRALAGPPGERGQRPARPDSGRLSPFGAQGPTGQGPMMSEEDREKIAQELNMTAEQREKVQAIFDSMRDKPPNERFQTMRQAMDILTPEQQQKFRETMRTRGPGEFMRRRAEQARKHMSPQEFEAYERRMKAIEERIQRGESPFPGMPAPPWRNGEGGPAGRGNTSEGMPPGPPPE